MAPALSPLVVGAVLGVSVTPAARPRPVRSHPDSGLPFCREKKSLAPRSLETRPRLAEGSREALAGPAAVTAAAWRAVSGTLAGGWLGCGSRAAQRAQQTGGAGTAVAQGTAVAI